MAQSASWSAISLASVLAGIAFTGACASDDEDGAPASDAGAGRGGGGGRGGSGGGAGAAGTGGSSDAATCTMAVAVPCDGPEDCPSGQRCCGKWEQDTEEYVEFGCFGSCIEQMGDAGLGTGGTFWFDLCHPGDTCEDPAARCLTSTYLPESLARCYDTGDPPDPSLGSAAGEVNCGTGTCGEREKCCLRGDREPYCAPANATCACDPADAGSDSGPDAAAPDATTPDSSDATAEAAPDSSDGASPEAGDASSDAAPD